MRCCGARGRRWGLWRRSAPSTPYCWARRCSCSSGWSRSSPRMSEPRPISIAAQDVSKDFRYGGSETLFRLLRRAVFGGKIRARTFRALTDVNLEVARGEIVGIVGNNGAGKTTLLKTLAGIYRPTEGRVRVEGAVSYFAGLGVGLVGDLSLRDNLFLYGAICGMRRSKVREVFDEVLEWAELTEFVDAPLRTLSTGMRGRFAFSVARHAESENLFLDEAFTAGDARFKDKCNQFFEQRRNGPQTILAATHSLDFARHYCTKALWMEYGKKRAWGDVDAVLDEYSASIESR
ncbi:MAG: ATP-binding cassette domain-containing protein [Acidobacteria bacterium]|nr:ATP-binding cassette domain-containing protein [Acidobacteriota bacterium]